MPYVVTDYCQKCRFSDCVSVCPVDCFHGDDEMLYIDPNACIDCGACEPECPVEAIQPDILVKGNDYTVATIVGADFVLGRGGRVETIALVPGYSTTKLIERLKQSY